MRDNLSPEFIAEFSRQGCSPIQVAIFKFSTGDRALSDRVFEYAPGLYTEDLIESWGDMPRTANTAETLAGSGVPIPSCTLTILNIGPDWFSGQISGITLEEVEVELWQYFRGIDDSYLIDRFIIQDNFQHGQGHLTLSLDLVSPLLASDPYVGTLDLVTNEYIGVSIGSLAGVLGVPFGVNPYAKITTSLSGGEPVIECDRDLVAVGFLATGGQIEIGWNIISYTGISGNNFIGCTNLTNPHSSGQYVTLYDHDYVFAFGTGPVDIAGPVFIAGEIYTGAYTIISDVSIVQVIFPDRLPNNILEETPGVYIDAILDAGYPLARVNFPVSAGDPLVICDRDLTAAGFPASGLLLLDYELASYDSISGDRFYIGSEHINFDHPIDEYVMLYPLDSIFFLPSGVIDVTKPPTINSGVPYDNDYTYGGTAESPTVTFPNSLPYLDGIGNSRIYYTDVAVCMLDRQSFDDPLMNIGDQNSAGVNPADAILSIGYKNPRLLFDDASFSTARTWFNDNGYVFNGFIPGDQRVLKTLLDMCQQCRSTLIHDNGYLYLKVNGLSSQSSMLFWSERENTVAKNSIQVSRQRAEDTKNWIDVRYDASDIQAGYQGGFTIKDQQSIDKQGRLQDTLDLYLIDDQVMANEIASYYLTDRKTPYTIITFKTYTEGFPLQIGDTVTLITRYSGFIIFKGRVVDTSPSFGSWKQKKMYHYNVTIAGYLPTAGDSGSTGHGAGLHGVQPHGL